MSLTNDGEGLICKVVWINNGGHDFTGLFDSGVKHAFIVFKNGKVYLKLLKDGVYSLNLTYNISDDQEELYELAKTDFG